MLAHQLELHIYLKIFAFVFMHCKVSEIPTFEYLFYTSKSLYLKPLCIGASSNF